MSSHKDEEFSNPSMCEATVNGREGLANRSLSGSFTRSRKNSRIATVKPVTKCLSSSEEDLNKTEKINAKGSASPRIARLLSKDMTSMDKDVIVAELEKCLAELENNDSPYTGLSGEYKRMEEERDELAKELENAFEDLEGYMHHVHDIEAALKSSEAEREELAKEVEYLKYCLTHRKEVEESSLKLGKEAVEAQLKEVNEENERMKEQINELLTDRESLIQSLLNLHSSEVDDVIQTRSRSCSVVSTDSASSSLLRSEHAELKERVKEAEEAEHKISVELQKSKEYLEETLKEKLELENCIENMKVEITEMEEDEMNLREKIEELKKEKKEEMKLKDKEIIEMKKEMARMKKEHEKSVVNDKKIIQQNESKDKATAELLKALEEEKARISKELGAVKEDLEKQKTKIAEEKERFNELKVKSKQDQEILRTKKLELKERTRELEEEKKKMGEIESELQKLKSGKSSTEKQMADIGEKLLNERAKGKVERLDLEKKVEELTGELELEREKNSKFEEQKCYVDKLSKEMDSLEDKNEELENEIKKLKTELKKHKEEMDLEKVNLKRKESDIIIKEKELKESQERVDQFKKELKNSSSSHDELKGEKFRIEKELDELKGKLGKEKEVFSNEKSSLKKTVENLQHEIDELKGVGRDLEKAKESLSKEKTLREKVEQKKMELNEELEEEKRRFGKEREKLENDLKASLASLDNLKKELDNSSGLKEKLTESNYKIRELEQSLSDAAKERKDAQNECSSEIEELKTAHEEEIKKLQEEFSSSRSKSGESSEKQIARLKSKVDDLNIFIERAETKVRELEGELKNAKKQLSDSESHVGALRKEKSTMQLEIGKMRSENSALKTDLDKLSRQLRNACADVEKAVSEKKMMKEQLEYSKFELENVNAMNKLTSETEENLMSEKINKHLKNHEELRKELLTEISRLKEEQRIIEMDLKATKNHLEQAQEKESKFRHSIDGLSENIERLRQEKSQVVKALELSKNENIELSGKLRKLTQNSSLSSEGSKIVAENEELRIRCNSLQEELGKAQSNSKGLLDKMRSSEEANANTMRSLKARKNELQIQLANFQHEKEDLEKEVRVLKDQIACHNVDVKEAQTLGEREAVHKLEDQIRTLKESVEDAEAKAKQLEEGSEGYKEKLHESEELILDLQKAVARANDVAMEKALESSRHKRIFEKKFEKILKENFALRKHLYFDGTNLDNDRNSHGRSLSDLASPTRGKHSNEVGSLDNIQSKFQIQNTRKKSAGELFTIVARDIDKERTSSLSRSGSAPLSHREGDVKPIRTKITAGSVTPPVRYTSDTDSIGSKPDSNDGDFTSSSPKLQKASMYHDADGDALQKEDDRQNAIPQPNRIHRPILLKEIKFPNLSTAEERHKQAMRSPGSRSPVMRSPAMRRSPGKRSPIGEIDNAKQQNGKERMEHWV